jgi:hypothetical protein
MSSGCKFCLPRGLLLQVLWQIDQNRSIVSQQLPLPYLQQIYIYTSQHGDIKHALPHPSHNMLAIHIPAPTISTSASFPSKPWMVSTSNRHRIHWRQQMASCCTVSFIISLTGVVTTVSLVCYHRRLLQCHNIYCNSELLSGKTDYIVWIQGVFEASHTVRPWWTNGPLGWPRLRTFQEFIVLPVQW